MKLKSIILTGLDFFLPNSCQACGSKILLEEVLLCRDCFSRLEAVNEDFAAEQYERHFSEDAFISGFCSMYKFEKDSPLQTILHNMKYRNNFRNGINLGQLVAGQNKDRLISWNPDLIVPVPLHRVKKAERGYNQAFYIAKGISRNVNVNLNDRIMRRKKLTETQTKLHIDERKVNVENAFEVRNIARIKDKTILLVDDVITTGSTVNECAKVLLSSGAKKIYAASVALA